MVKPKQHRCKVCSGFHESGNELRYSKRFNAYVHEKCKTTCLRCRKPKSPEGFICEDCEKLGEAGKQDVILPPSVNTRDAFRPLAMGGVSRRPYGGVPGLQHDDDDD